MFANTASNVVGAISAAQVSGSSTNQITFTNVNNSFGGTLNGTFNGTANGSFSGNGASLTNLNASNLATGTVADARLSTNVALLNASQTFGGVNTFTGNNQFTGANNFTNTGNRFTGSFFGNGNVGWDAFNGPSVQAEFNHGYLLTNAQPAVVTLPPTLPANDITNIGYIVRISGAGIGGWRVAQNANQSIYGNFLTASNTYWQVSPSGPNNGMGGIFSSADGFTMLAVAGSGGIYQSVDSGRNWNAMSSIISATCVAGSSDGTRLAVADKAAGGKVVLSTDAGNTWSATIASSANFQSLSVSSDGSRMIGCVSGSRIYISSNYGTNWNQIVSSPVNVNSNWYSVASSADGSRCAVVVNGGQIYTSSNYGSNWVLQAGSVKTNWTAICCSTDGSRLAAAVSGGKIYTSADYGVTWNIQTNAPTGNWSALDCSSDGGRLIASVNGGGVYLSVNFGFSWVKQPMPDKNWTAVACSADCTKMSAVYFDGTTSGGIYFGQSFMQTTTATSTLGTGGSIGGSQGSSVELQYLGNGQFMPVSSAGTIWAN
jgi:hypothetical protein